MDPEAIKNEGNAFFKEGQYKKAIEKYTDAINLVFCFYFTFQLTFLPN